MQACPVLGFPIVGSCRLNPARGKSGHPFCTPLEYKIYIIFDVTGKVQAHALIWHRNYVCDFSNESYVALSKNILKTCKIRLPF